MNRRPQAWGESRTAVAPLTRRISAEMAGTTVCRSPIMSRAAYAVIGDGDTTPRWEDGTAFYRSSGSFTFQVVNKGNAPLITSGLTAPTRFVIQDGLAALIAPGASDTVTRTWYCPSGNAVLSQEIDWSVTLSRSNFHALSLTPLISTL